MFFCGTYTIFITLRLQFCPIHLIPIIYLSTSSTSALYRFIRFSTSSASSLHSLNPLHPLNHFTRFILFHPSASSIPSASSTHPLHRFIASSLHSLYSTSSTLVLHWRHYFICVINSIQNQTPKINDVRIMAILNPFNQSPLTNPITTKRTSVNCTNRTDNRGSLYHFSIYSKLKAL